MCVLLLTWDMKMGQGQDLEAILALSYKNTKDEERNIFSKHWRVISCNQSCIHGQTLQTFCHQILFLQATETNEQTDSPRCIHTTMSLIYSNTTLFREKWWINTFKHPHLKLLFQYPNTYTLRSSVRGRRMSTKLRQSLWNYNRVCWTSTSLRQSLQSLNWG